MKAAKSKKTGAKCLAAPAFGAPLTVPSLLALERGCRQGSYKEGTSIAVEVDVDIGCSFGFEGGSSSGIVEWHTKHLWC